MNIISTNQEKCYFLNMCNLCRYAWFSQAQSHIWIRILHIFFSTIYVYHHDNMYTLYYVNQFSAVHVVPSKYSCPTSWSREYYGYLMAGYFDNSRSQFICVDYAFKATFGLRNNKDGLKYNKAEGRCGSLLCHPFDSNKKFTYVACTK